MPRHSNHISILQFDERVMTLLRVRRSVKGVDVLDLQRRQGTWSAADGSLEAALAAFVKEHRVTGDAVYTVLPRHEMTARLMSLPSHDLAEIKGMVRLSAEEFVPYALDDLVIDQCVLRKTSSGASQVLAVFAHRDVVEGHLDLLRGAGIEPREIYVSAACLASAAIAAKRNAEAPCAVLNLASGGLEALVVRGTRLEFARGLATAQDWSTLSDDAIEELAVETRASLSAYRREAPDAAEIEHLYLCGESANLKEACDVLTHETGCACEPAAFDDALVVRGKERVDALPAVSLGAALNAQDRGAVTITLVPESLVRTREMRALRSAALRVGALVAVVMAACAGVYVQGSYQMRAYIAELEQRTEEVMPRSAGVSEKHRQLMLLQRQVDRGSSAFELLAHLCDLAPASGLNITRFGFKRDEGITITGRALSEDRVIDFARRLRDTGDEVPHFSQARSGDSTLIRERHENVIEYQLDIPFPREPEEEDVGEEPDFE